MKTQLDAQEKSIIESHLHPKIIGRSFPLGRAGDWGSTVRCRLRLAVRNSSALRI